MYIAFINMRNVSLYYMTFKIMWMGVVVLFL